MTVAAASARVVHIATCTRRTPSGSAVRRTPPRDLHARTPRAPSPRHHPMSRHDMPPTGPCPAPSAPPRARQTGRPAASYGRAGHRAVGDLARASGSGRRNPRRGGSAARSNRAHVHQVHADAQDHKRPESNIALQSDAALAFSPGRADGPAFQPGPESARPPTPESFAPVSGYHPFPGTRLAAGDVRLCSSWRLAARAYEPTSPKPRRPSRPAQFLQTYTEGLTREDVQRLFTRDTREAYRFFARSMDEEALGQLPWHRRAIVRARLFFWAFTLKLSPGAAVALRPGPAVCRHRAVQAVPRLRLLVGLPIFLGVVIVKVGVPSAAVGAGHDEPCSPASSCSTC